MTTFTWITPRSAPRGANPDLAITLSCLPVKSGSKMLRISLYAAALEQLGWELGDRVQLGFAADHGAVALRKHQAGNKLRSTDTAAAAALNVTAPADTPVFKSQRVMLEDCRVADGTLLVATPWLAASVATPEPEAADA